jgi:flagellar motor switch protein FliG
MSATMDYTGVKRAAALIVAVGEDHAAEILRHLPEADVEAITMEIARLDKISEDVSAAIISSTVEKVAAEGEVHEGGLDYARRLLARRLDGDHATRLVARMEADLEKPPLEFLKRTPAEQLCLFLGEEAPQTIALVLAHLATGLAAEVMKLLPSALQADVSRRLATLSEVRPEVLAAVDVVMQQNLSSLSTQDTSAAGGVQSLADILNHADRTTERNVLDEIAKSNADLADEVRVLLFTFEDVAKLEDREIQMILKDVDQKDLVLALRGVPDGVAAKIFKNMSERGADNLREEISFQRPQKRSVIEEAQARIVAVVRRLEESGDLVLSRGGGAAEGGDELV